MNDEISHRIERLEDRDRANSVLVGTLGTEMQTMGTRLLKMEKVLEQVRDRVLSMQGCPDPGICFQLKARLGIVETQLREIETERSVMTRGWRKLVAFATGGIVFGTVIYWMYVAIEAIVHKHPKP